MTKKTAIILFNLGGPDEPKAVKPFLFNLFNDPAIISLPSGLRWLVAQIISGKRAPKARDIYSHIGGKSPIAELTNQQAKALEEHLTYQDRDTQYKAFVCMRYWHPMSDIVVRNVKNFAPDNIILLPLYPQYSITTTRSSMRDWDRAARSVGLNVPTSRICCYPTDLTFITSHAKLIKDAYWKASENGKPRVLFSAHGLPEKIIKKGDPYQWQVEQTVEKITQVLSIEELDYAICYQSKVGPMKWLKPSAESEIKRAGKDGIPLLFVPVSFVSDHSETLVEIDIEYRRLAEKSGVTGFVRVPALGVETLFIEALGDLCLKAGKEGGLCSFAGGRNCPASMTQCPYGNEKAA